MSNVGPTYVTVSYANSVNYFRQSDSFVNDQPWSFLRMMNWAGCSMLTLLSTGVQHRLSGGHEGHVPSNIWAGGQRTGCPPQFAHKRSSFRFTFQLCATQ